jgi:Uncharacterized protein conserved in archaea
LSLNESPRKKLLELIGMEPGLHFRGIQRKTGYSIGQLEYHLYKLEHEDQITIRKDGRYNRYFIRATAEADAKKLSYHIRNRINRKLLLFILRRENISIEDLTSTFNDREVLQLSLAQLHGDNVILYNKNTVSVRNPEFVKNYLRRSKTMFMEELADSLIDMLDEKD